MKPASYKGDCIATVYAIVNTTLAPYGLEIARGDRPELGADMTHAQERLAPRVSADELMLNYPIEQICEILADVEPAEFPLCACGRDRVLIPCKGGCHQFVCDVCRPDHSCGGGDNPAPFRY